MSDSAEEQQQPSAGTDTAEDATQMGQVTSEQVEEAPEPLRKRVDVTRALEKMTEGVLVELHISRPRLTITITRRKRGKRGMDGLEKLGLAPSGAGAEVIRGYFSLGRHSLLPKEDQDKLATAENAARACLERFALRTHWGYFVPLTNYREWRAENERHEKAFWELKEDILGRYDEIIARVLSDYLTLAEDAWMQLTFGELVVGEDREQLSQELFAQLYQQLNTGQGKDAFIERYLEGIRQAIPAKEELADAFEYTAERSTIPLPSQLARDMQEADQVTRERMLRDEQFRAEMDVIAAKRRAEIEAINAQQRVEEEQRRAELAQLSEQQRLERELSYAQVRVERDQVRLQEEKIRLQEEMQRDLVAQARQQKQQLVTEFYNGIVVQINELVREVCDSTLESLDENGGVLRGPVSERLRDLVRKLERLNFIEDTQIEQQIARLQAVLPTQYERDEAKKGIARIDTTRIRRVVEELKKEAEATIVEIGLSPRPRTRRQVDVSLDEAALIPGETRRARIAAGLDFSSRGSATKRRARKTL